MVNKKNNRKGVTLVELIIVLALLSLTIALGMNFLLTGSKVFSKGSSQYNVQSSVRLAAANISDAVRFASAVEILSVNPNSYSDDFDYIYLNGDTIIHSFINDQGNRTQRLLARDLTSLSFANISSDEQLLGLYLTGVENAQDYQIELDLALPNFQIWDQQISGENTGEALMFYRDRTGVEAGSPAALAIAPGTGFELVEGASVTFYANKNVSWSSSASNIISVSQTGSMTAKATAMGSIGSSATITATTVDSDPVQTRSVTIKIVEQSDYTVDIVLSSSGASIDVLNIVKDTAKNVQLVFTPSEFAEGVEIKEIIWDEVFPSEETGYLTLIEDETNAALLEVIGSTVGDNANLSVEVTLTDGTNDTVISDSIIVNVMPVTEYAKLSQLSFNIGSLSPSFNPNTNSYSYVYTEAANNDVYITVNSPGADSTISIGGVTVAKGVPYYTGQKAKHSWTLTIAVNEPGKLTSSYTVTSTGN